jgi:HSP20 family protein
MAKKDRTGKQEKARSPRTTKIGMNPWEEMERWLERTGRYGWVHPGFREWPPHLESFAAFPNGAPKVDVIDRDLEVVVRAELPGVAKADLDVTVTDDSVTLRAHTSHEEKQEKGEYHRREMSYGEYLRTLALPHAVDGEKAKATFNDGVLELTLPKVEKTSRKQVTVE